MWNVSLSVFFFYGRVTWTKLELLLLASRERYLWESELTWLVNYATKW